ncbi:MAG: hypothetical protein AMXMBFR84_05940 [Candidatus Hydrogenedentota bacterium]
MTVFETIVKPLLFLHLLSAICALATAIHLAVRIYKTTRHPGSYAAQTRMHATIMTVSYGLCFGLGALIYPTFRLRVRGELFDDLLPWATGLFEIKEHLASFALMPALGVWVFSRTVDLRNREHRPYLTLYASCIAVVIVVLTFNAWCGWYLGTLKSV